MTRARLLVCALVAIACGSAAPQAASPRDARPPAEPREPEHTVDAERAARVAIDRCGVTRELPRVPAHGPEDEEYSSLSVTVDRGGAFLIRYSEWGNGVDASYGGFDELFDPRTCARLRSEWSSTDGDILRSVAFVWRRRGAPTPAEIARLSEAEAADSASPAHAFARMRLLARCPGFDSEPREIHPDRTRDVLGPLAEAQPWLRGAPAQSVDSFWTDALLDSIGARDDVEDDGDEDEQPSSERLEGVIVPATGPPARVRAVGAMELWASSHDDRNGAVALAIYDPARDRHRWIGLTRGCVNGASVDWIAEDGDLLLGHTRSRHPVYEQADGVLVVDAASAHAFVLEQRGTALALEGEPGRRTPAQTAAWAALRARVREVTPPR